MRLFSVLFGLLLLLGGTAAAREEQCHVILTCEQKTCMSIPGNFVQKFVLPEGGVGQTTFMIGRAYIFANQSEVVPTIREGKVPKSIRYVAYPDDTGRAGDWLDAYLMAVKYLSWTEDGPKLSKETSIMACSTGDG